MIKRRIGMSTKVLERKRERLKGRVMLTLWCLFLLCASSILVYSIWIEHKNSKALNAPTWADFTTLVPGTASVYQTNLGITPDGIPNTLWINGQSWSVVRVAIYDSNLDKPTDKTWTGVDAETYCEHRTISYAQSVDRQMLRVNLMHEVFHAGACLHGGAAWWNSTDLDKHPGIYHLGEFMAIFAHDNPEFMRWEEQ